MPSVRIVGIGQRAAGDDGAGPAVLDRLREEGVSVDIELCEAAEPSVLMPLLENAQRVIVVDAALSAGKPGTVLVVRPEDIEARPLSPVSTHGMSVGQAIALARVLSPDRVCADIHLVALAAERPAELAYGLSPLIEAALPAAVSAVRTLAAEATAKEHGSHA